MLNLKGGVFIFKYMLNLLINLIFNVIFLLKLWSYFFWYLKVNRLYDYL